MTASGIRQEIVWPKAKTTALPVSQSLVVKVKYPVNSQAKIYALYVTE